MLKYSFYLSLSRCHLFLSDQFQNTTLHLCSITNMLNIIVSSILSWKPHIINITKYPQKLGVLYRCHNIFSWKVISCLQVSYSLQYRSSTAQIFGIFLPPPIYWPECNQKPSISLILWGSPLFQPSLSVQHDVAALSLFYRYCFGHTSHELSAHVPTTNAWAHDSHLAVASHNTCVETIHARCDHDDIPFFPQIVKMRNFFLSLSPLPIIFFLMKSQVCTHLRSSYWIIYSFTSHVFLSSEMAMIGACFACAMSVKIGEERRQSCALIFF